MKTGDIVKQKGKEIKMTVRSIAGNEVTVNYFDSSRLLREEVYFDYKLEVL